MVGGRGTGRGWGGRKEGRKRNIGRRNLKVKKKQKQTTIK
jgi:hypothetical protein